MLRLVGQSAERGFYALSVDFLKVPKSASDKNLGQNRARCNRRGAAPYLEPDVPDLAIRDVGRERHDVAANRVLDPYSHRRGGKRADPSRISKVVEKGFAVHNEARSLADHADLGPAVLDVERPEDDLLSCIEFVLRDFETGGRESADRLPGSEKLLVH